MTQLPELMTIKELQNHLGIGKDRAYAILKSKSFPALKIGGRYYVVKHDLAAWLGKHARQN